MSLNLIRNDENDEETQVGAIEREKSVKVSIEPPETVRRDLIAYPEILGQQDAQEAIEPSKLIAPTLCDSLRITAYLRGYDAREQKYESRRIAVGSSVPEQLVRLGLVFFKSWRG